MCLLSKWMKYLIYYTHALVNRSLIKRHFEVILPLLLYEILDL